MRSGTTRPARFAWWRALPPLALIVALVFWFLATDPLSGLEGNAPPIEELTIERATLDEVGIKLRVRADGSEPVSIAQVLVDGAYWSFRQDPEGPLARLRTARIEIPYPWVEGETHHITLLTRNGLAFEHTIEVATTSPTPGPRRLLAFALLGLYVGFVPVSLGLLFYPYLRTIGRRGMYFLLALTVGLLAFLFVDTLEEATELAIGAAGAFQANGLVWLGALLSFVTLMAVGRRHGRPTGVALAFFLALGIGLHNLGEGLAIGAAYAAGEAALGSFLVVGFTLHNLSEGIGIASPLTRQSVRLPTFIGLAALAGLPTVLGTWTGAFAFAPHWAALFLGIGAGAILQVMVEVGSHLAATARSEGDSWVSGTTLAGFAVGLAVMYATAFLVTV